MYMTKAIMGHVEAGVLAGNYSAYEVVGSIAAGRMCIWDEGTDIWVVGGQELSAGEAMVPLYVASSSGTMQSALLWANHDILDITSLDMTTGAYKTGDIYFWKSGYENVTLPPIPVELKNRYNVYGIIRVTSPVKTCYYLAGGPTFGAYVSPEQLGENYGALYCKSKTGYIAYEYNVDESTDWEFLRNPPYGNGWCNIGVKGAYTYVITNINSDIYYAATFDPITEDITYSSDVYFAKNIFDEVETPTRVSIGKNLMDGFADEAQRLTGTTDQMNAVQIREKLAAVRTRINIGDESLPPIPDDILANYPYVVVLKLTSNVVTGAIEYRLCASTSMYAYVPEGVMAGEYGNYKLIGTLTDAKIANCYNSSATEWGNWNDHPAGNATYVLSDYQQAEGVTVHTAVVWANHDIYEITSLDMSTGDFTVGGIYFSERQNYGNLCLPKLPHEIASEYPYAVLIKSIMTYGSTTAEIYYLLMATTQFGYIDKGMLTGTVAGINAANYEWVGSMTKGWSATFSSSSTEWDIDTSGVSAGNAMMILGANNLMDFSFVWANHDIYKITSLDMTTGDYTMGDRYYPVFADADDERVSIGYDLFNDIVEQIQRLSNNEEKMNALRAYWKLTTVV